jgi:hypothetical protein
MHVSQCKMAVPSLLLLLFIVARAAAEGCAMCYQNAAASGAVGRAALRHGVLILLVPAIGLFCGILALLYRRGHPRSPSTCQQARALNDGHVSHSMFVDTARRGSP